MEERGQVLPLVAVLVVAAGVVCLVVGRLGGAAVARAQAVTAADAAALAGAAEGRQAARLAAEANGARLDRFQQRGPDARAEVAFGMARATAAARRRAGGGGPAGGLAPALRAALARLEQLVGRRVAIVPAGSGDLAAGRHRAGMAFDVAAWMLPSVTPAAAGAGLCQPHPDTHPVHFELCPDRLP